MGDLGDLSRSSWCLIKRRILRCAEFGESNRRKIGLVYVFECSVCIRDTCLAQY